MLNIPIKTVWKWGPKKQTPPIDGSADQFRSAARAARKRQAGISVSRGVVDSIGWRCDNRIVDSLKLTSAEACPGIDAGGVWGRGVSRCRFMVSVE